MSTEIQEVSEIVSLYNVTLEKCEKEYKRETFMVLWLIAMCIGLSLIYICVVGWDSVTKTGMAFVVVIALLLSNTVAARGDSPVHIIASPRKAAYYTFLYNSLPSEPVARLAQDRQTLEKIISGMPQNLRERGERLCWIVGKLKMERLK